MTIQERNDHWTGEKRHFVHPKAGGRYWAISVKGDNIRTEYCKLNGKMTQASETCKPLHVGKANEKPAEAVALDKAREIVRKKHLEGYQEHVLMADKQLCCVEPVVHNDIDFDNLPPNLCFYKPHNSVEGKLEKTMNAGKALYTVKRNGHMFVIARGKGKPKLYSRRMHRQHDDETGTKYTWDDRFEHIINDAAKVMPHDSIMLGELVMVNGDYSDNFKNTQRVVKSTTPDAITLQRGNAGHAYFYVWDIAFWDAEDLGQRTVQERFDLIADMIGKHPGARTTTYLLPLQYGAFDSHKSALTHAQQVGLEGYVVVDPDGIYGEKMYNFKGKPDRPRAFCGKLKPEFEDEFVVEWDPAKKVGEFSLKDKYAEGKPGIKSVMLYQYNRKGEKIPICQLGVGLTEEIRIKMADPKKFPVIWRVKYTDRRYISQGDDTNALDFPRIDTDPKSPAYYLATDKTPEECINEEL